MLNLSENDLREIASTISHSLGAEGRYDLMLISAPGSDDKRGIMGTFSAPLVSSVALKITAVYTLIDPVVDQGEPLYVRVTGELVATKQNSAGAQYTILFSGSYEFFDIHNPAAGEFNITWMA